MARENFPLNMQEELQSLGLDITQVPPGRYVEIDLGVDRREKEMFAEYGSFDTFTVLNSRELKGLDIFIYLNTPSPVGRYPLELIRGINTIADRFYLEHRPYPGAKLKLILGGDLRALKIDPTDQGSTNIDGAVSVDNMPLVQINTIIQELEEIRSSIDNKNNQDVINAIDDILSKLDSLDVTVDNMPLVQINTIIQELEEILNELKDRIPSGILIGITEQIGSISGHLGDLRGDILGSTGNLMGEMNTVGYGVMGETFSFLSQYLITPIMNDLDSIDTKLTQLVSIKSVLDDVSSKLDTLTTMDSKLAGIDSKIGGLETNVEGLYNLLNSQPIELAGATLASRPAADSVPAGSTFTLVQSPIVIYMSDGSAWVELS